MNNEIAAAVKPKTKAQTLPAAQTNMTVAPDGSMGAVALETALTSVLGAVQGDALALLRNPMKTLAALRVVDRTGEVVAVDAVAQTRVVVAYQAGMAALQVRCCEPRLVLDYFQNFAGAVQTATLDALALPLMAKPLLEVSRQAPAVKSKRLGK